MMLDIKNEGVALDCSEIQAVKGYLCYKENCDGGGNAAFFCSHFALLCRNRIEGQDPLAVY